MFPGQKFVTYPRLDTFDVTQKTVARREGMSCPHIMQLVCLIKYTDQTTENYTMSKVPSFYQGLAFQECCNILYVDD